MRIDPKRFACAAVLLGACAAAAHAAEVKETYPARPIRLVIPLAAGGAVDSVARTIQPYLGDALGQQIVIDNRPGAGGIIGTDVAAKAPADGYTLLMWDNSLTVIPNLHKSLPFNAAKDFVPVTSVSIVPYILGVSASSSYKSVSDLIAAAKSKPHELNYGSAGVGSPPHLAAALLTAMTGVSATHVAFKGAPQGFGEVVGGRLDFMVASIPVVKPHNDSGKARGLAVTTPKRTQALPTIPTVEEAGIKGYDVSVWNGLFAPAGTPAAIVAKIDEHVQRLLANPEIQEKLAFRGAEVRRSSQTEFSKYFAQEFPKWARVVQRSGATAQ